MTLPFFLAVALKGAVVLALAGLATLLLRRAPASARHGVWAAAFCGLLLLPVLEAIGPRWDVSVLPASASSFAVSLPAPPAPLALPAPPTPPTPPAPPAPVLAFRSGEPLALTHEVAAIEAEVAAFEAEMASFEAEMLGMEAEMKAFAAETAALATHRAALDAEAAAVTFLDVPRPARGLSTPVTWLVGAWALGALIVGLGWLSAFLSARRLVGMATVETDEEWAVLAERARRLSGLPDRIRLLRSDRLDVPIAWGYGRPAVVLPASAETWTTERREAVLLHEMAHLRRHDAWTQVLAQAAVALHWVNPLAWVGYRRFLDAREQACDDAVLQGGARPSAYAQHLVGVARSLKRDRLALAAVAPMARRVPLESRVCSILDASRRRSSLGRPAFRSSLGVALLFLLPLAALRPVAMAQEAPVAPDPVVEVSAQIDALQTELDRAAADAEASELDFEATEAEMDAAMAEIEASLEHLEATAEAEMEIRGAVTALDDVDHDVDIDIDLDDLANVEFDLSDVEVSIEGTLGDLGGLSARFVRLVETKVEHDDEVCPEEVLVVLKRAGLDEETRDEIIEVLTDENVRIERVRDALADAQDRIIEASNAETIAVRAADREAQRAAAEARRHALSFSVRGSTPPRRFRQARRADSLSVFDWNAVDRARLKAVSRHHRAAS